MLRDPKQVQTSPDFDINDLNHFSYSEGSYKGADINEKIATIKFNRPEKANATNRYTYTELNDLLDYVTARYIDDNPIDVVIVTGADTYFSAGAEFGRDGTEYRLDGEEYDKAEFFHEENMKNIKEYMAGERTEFNMLTKILRAPQIFIGAINGPATGLGLEVATAPDIRVAHKQNAVFGVNEAVMGLTPLNMGVLRQLMGASQAKRFMLRGTYSFPNYMEAEEARFTGLMDEVVEQEDYDEHIAELAQGIAAMPAEQCRFIKETMNHSILRDAEETATRQFPMQTVLRGRDFQREQRQKLVDKHAGAGDESKTD